MIFLHLDFRQTYYMLDSTAFIPMARFYLFILKNKSMRFIVNTLFLIFFSQTLLAQKDTVRMSLDDCINYAVENGYNTNMQKSRTKDSEIDYKQAIMNHLPSISGSVGIETAFGRGIDPETNSYINQSSLSNGYNITGNIPIFQGFSLFNQTRRAKISKLRGESELVKVKDEIAIKTILAFAEAIYNRELVVLSEQMVEKYSLELKKATRRLELGAGSKADLMQIQAGLSQEKLTLIKAENLFEISIIKLKEIMSFPLAEHLSLVKDENQTLQMTLNPGQTVEEILEIALDSNPKAVISKQTLEVEKLSLSIAKGNYYPSLSLSGGVNSAFFRSLDSKPFSSYNSQIRNNLGEWVGLSLSIPIFNRNERRTNVKLAKNNLERAILTHKNESRILESEIRQCFMELDACRQAMEQSLLNVEYHKLANEAISKRFEKGASSLIELQTSDANLFRAEVESRNASLKYQIKIREINYYKGQKLWIEK